MTFAAYVDRMFMYATGWLGWPPEVALDTPFPLIELALDGKVDFITRTTPGASPPKKPPGRAELQSKIRAAFSAFKGGAA